MRRLTSVTFAIGLTMISAVARGATEAGDATRGRQLYRACAACHSLAPDRNMSGPSLAGLWGRKAGSLKSFERYSPALKASNVLWNETTLDPWLAAPTKFIPQSRMPFAGISNAQQRSDLIAFLKQASSGNRPESTDQGRGMGMAPQFRDLKKLGPDFQVQAIRYCRDTYHVTTAGGKSLDFWEANLRFKTDSSDTGPLGGTPIILPAGMMGDRASIFFAAPEEIATFIKHQC